MPADSSRKHWSTLDYAGVNHTMPLVLTVLLWLAAAFAGIGLLFIAFRVVVMNIGYGGGSRDVITVATKLGDVVCGIFTLAIVFPAAAIFRKRFGPDAYSRRAIFSFVGGFASLMLACAP